jgi:hypothetical protein
VELGKRLAAQILHVQWGWSNNMSTSPAALAVGLESVDWVMLSACKNTSATELDEPLEPKYSPELAQGDMVLGTVEHAKDGKVKPLQNQIIAATPPMGTAQQVGLDI